ncbi:MAG TPA: HxsD-like protein [bacterium]|nr:HxsD-like protein [bacterium]
MKEKHRGQAFHIKIYPPRIVKKAASRYAEHVKVNVIADDDYTYVDFVADENEKEILEGEFSNYVLYLIGESRN